MQFLILLATLGSSVAASHKYEIGIRTQDTQVHPWGDLNLGPSGPSAVASFVPVDEASEAPTEGCVGVISETGFACHTLFQFEAGHQRNAIRAYIDSNGDLTQVQLTEGNPSQVFIEVPHVVSQALVQPKPAFGSAKAKDGKEGVKAAWKEARQDAGEKSDEDKTFLEKYWVYLVPAALILVSNALGRGAAQ